MKSAKPKLLRINSPGRRTHLLRQGGVLRIGRHASNDVVIDDERVSRFHCLVAWTQEASHPYVRDLGSQNGTRLDGEPVAERTLWGGEVLSLGPARVRVDLVDEPARASARQAVTPTLPKGTPLTEDEAIDFASRTIQPDRLAPVANPDAVATALRPIIPGQDDDDDDDDDDDGQLFDESDPRVAGAIQDPVALRNVIVGLEQEHRSGTLHVGCGPLRARLTFAGGRVVTARLEQDGAPVTSAQAIRALLACDLTGGTYRFALGIESEAPTPEGEPVLEYDQWLGLRLKDLLQPIDLPSEQPTELPVRPSAAVQDLQRAARPNLELHGSAINRSA